MRSGRKIELLHEPVTMTISTESFRSLMDRELRNAIGLRNLRPAAHFGLLFTHGLAWVILSAIILHSFLIVISGLLLYSVLRSAMAWGVSTWALKTKWSTRSFHLLVCLDIVTFVAWFGSFFRNRIRWGGAEFVLRDGKLTSFREFVPEESLPGHVSLAERGDT